MLCNETINVYPTVGHDRNNSIRDFDFYFSLVNPSATYSMILSITLGNTSFPIFSLYNRILITACIIPTITWGSSLDNTPRSIRILTACIPLSVYSLENSSTICLGSFRTRRSCSLSWKTRWRNGFSSTNWNDVWKKEASSSFGERFSPKSSLRTVFLTSYFSESPTSNHTIMLKYQV